MTRAFLATRELRLSLPVPAMTGARPLMGDEAFAQSKQWAGAAPVSGGRRTWSRAERVVKSGIQPGDRWVLFPSGALSNCARVQASQANHGRR